MKPVRVYLDVYGIWIIGFLGVPANVVSAYIQKNYSLSLDFTQGDGGCTLLTHGTGGAHVIVHTNSWSSKPADLSLFTHEVLHAAILCCEYIGQDIDTGSHEHLTYLHQFIFESLMTKKNYKKKRK